MARNRDVYLTKRLTFSHLRLMLELIFIPFLLGVGCNFQHDGGKALSTSELETHLVTPHDNITLWYPSLSADGRVLASLGGTYPEDPLSEIYVISWMNNETIYRSETEKGTWSSVSISPDGRKVAACGAGVLVSGTAIYIIDLEQGSMSMVAEGCNPAWSPNGNKTAFTRLGEELRESVYPVQILLLDLTDNSQTPIFATQVRFGSIYFLAWSKDEQQLAFAMLEGFDYSSLSPNEPNLEQMPPQLYVINVDGSRFKRLTDGTVYVQSPVFLNDKRILFLDLLVPLGECNNVFVTNVEGEGQRVCPEVERIERLSLSIDSSYIALDTRQGLFIGETEKVFNPISWELGSDGVCPDVIENP